VILWLAFRRLLPLLAVLSLALMPVAAPAAVAGMHAPMAHADPAAAAHPHGHAMAAMEIAEAAMAAMPCCPPEAAEPADSGKGCLKGCPLMALCLGSLASLPPAGIGLPVPSPAGTAVFAPRADGFASVTGMPPSEPPRS
jgi:hypothetical protein